MPNDNSLKKSRLLPENDVTARETTTPGRQKWSSQLDFIMAGIGAAVGLGNIWRFPFLCYKNGGGAFLIPYLISFMLMSAPTYILEIGLGQYTGEGCVGAWNIIPAFKGVGACGAVILWYIVIYYIIVIAWSLNYFFVSLRAEVPWATCGNTWNTDRCFVSGMTLNRTIANCSEIIDGNETSSADCSVLPTVDAVEEYWERHVLGQSRGIEEPGELVPGLSLSLLVSWIIVFVCLSKGIKWTGKLVYLTALLPYVLLTVILVRGVMLEGAREGVTYYLRPDFSRLADGQVWIDAATQVLFSTGVGQGYLFTLGSYNKFHANPVRNGLIITSINCVTSLFGGFCVFAVLGFMAKETGQSIEKVVSSGPGLAFLTYPKAMTQLPLTPLWSALFFATLVFLGLDSEVSGECFAVVEGIMAILMDAYPSVLYKPRNRFVFLAVFCCTSCLAGLAMVTEGGIYVFSMVDHYAVCGIVLLITVFCEALVIGWFFGADKFADALELMVGYRVGIWIKLGWKIFTPLATLDIALIQERVFRLMQCGDGFWMDVIICYLINRQICFGITLFQVSAFRPLQYGDGQSYPPWTTWVGVILILSSTACIPLVLVYRMLTAKGGLLKQRWVSIATPRLRRHQVHPKWKYECPEWRYQDYSDPSVGNLWA